LKTISFIGLLFLVIFSCSKTEDFLTIDCSNYFGTPPPVVCNGTLCQSDTCATYTDIWKKMFISKNQISEDYFNNHIKICNTATYKYAKQGIQFEIAYKYSLDWFEVKFEEGFMIWLFPSYLQNNPNISLPGEVLLSKDQINANINNPFFGYAIHKISPINHLKYSSRQEAVEVLAHAAGVNDLCESTLSIQYQNIANPPIGHPVLTGSGALNGNENKCVSGIMDLSTDYYKVDTHECMIVFCFTKGTSIVLNNNHDIPIEKIKPGDKILSFNLNTMNIEEDIVQQIDSVKHSDIIHILFNDMTKNDNTSDHPYYVKNKGWCSYKPSQTMQKYNLRTKLLQIGDTCFRINGNQLTEVQIKNITENSEEVMTYNISKLARNKTYFANGILVSNESN
jgi:hypothetical protein